MSALMFVPMFLPASCMSSGERGVAGGELFSAARQGDTDSEKRVSRNETERSSVIGEPDILGAARARASRMDSPEDAVPDSEQASASGTSPGGRRVSLRRIDNVHAGDLLDHWGISELHPLSARLEETSADGDMVAGFRGLLEAAHDSSDEWIAPGLQEGEAVTVPGRRHGVTHGRSLGGTADRLSIDIGYGNATSAIRNDGSFKAALERAGKAWSYRIADIWTKWEREAGESKSWLVGSDGVQGGEILVGAGGEKSTGLTVYVTGVDLEQAEARTGFVVYGLEVRGSRIPGSSVSTTNSSKDRARRFGSP